MLSDSDFRFCLQQIDGRQRTRDKLPTFAQIDGWLYPPRLNLEQCSSERAARFKASLLLTLNSQTRSSNTQFKRAAINLIDATGGYGVDTFFMSEVAAQTHYFEQNTDLAAIADHNFRLAGKSIHCHPEPFTVQSLSTSLYSTPNPLIPNPLTVIYIDPARRDNHGGKVFRLEDCTPNVIEIIRLIRLIREQQNSSISEPQIRVLLKLSPMLDFHQAVAQLGGSWDVYVVSVNNEVKELLLLSDVSTALPIERNQISEITCQISKIHAVMLTDNGDNFFSFTPDEESNAEVQYLPMADSQKPMVGMYVYEPDAALLKAGAFRLISARYNLTKAAPNTHQYFRDQKSDVRNQMLDISGRWWQIFGVYTRVKDVQRALKRANVLTRNYTLPADALRKQLRLKDGGDDYIIGCRIADKPLLLHCRRLQ